MSFWATFEADVNKGLELAAEIIGTFLPVDSTLLTDIAESVAAIETIFAKPSSAVTPSTVSAIVQSATVMSVVNQASNAKLYTASVAVAAGIGAKKLT
jgi:hypothetical protein